MRLIDADAIPWTDLNADMPNTKIKVLITFADKVNRMPTIEERKKGKWVIEPDRTVMHCNVCGWAFEYYAGLEEEWNYCPYCGADMRGERE